MVTALFKALNGQAGESQKLSGVTGLTEINFRGYH